MITFNLFWSPEGRKIATVEARDARAAIRKAPAPYRKFLGEIYAEEVTPIHCDQCQMLSINGVACHETGCPNSRKTWLAERGEWVRFVECYECGCEVEQGEVCSCHETDGDL